MGLIDKIDDSVLEDAVMAGTPEFLDLPEDMQQKIADATVAKERFFWLSNNNVPNDVVTRTLLRRAIYAEQRVLETEYMLGEMALICESAKKRVEELEDRLDEVLKVT